MENYFYVESNGMSALVEKIVMVNGEYKFYMLYVDSDHIVANKKSRDGGFGTLLAPWWHSHHARSAHFRTYYEYLTYINYDEMTNSTKFI